MDNLDEILSKGKHEVDEHTEEINKYTECMIEIKQRLLFLKERLALGSSNERKLFDTEIICYQFRAIIELILLSSLVAHKKYYMQKLRQITGLYKIEVIINTLADKNPKFYPTAINEPKVNKDGQNIAMQMVYKETPFLTLEDAKLVYRDCSEYLHSKNPFAAPKNYQVWAKFTEWYNKITALLHWHILNMFNVEKGFMVNLDFQATEKDKEVLMVYLKFAGTETFQVQEHSE